jgi:hypothetical protein
MKQALSISGIMMMVMDDDDDDDDKLCMLMCTYCVNCVIETRVLHGFRFFVAELMKTINNQGM